MKQVTLPQETCANCLRAIPLDNCDQDSDDYGTTIVAGSTQGFSCHDCGEWSCNPCGDLTRRFCHDCADFTG